MTPEQAAEFRRLIRGMHGRRTVLLSTHILSEVRLTCDRVMIINQGRVLALDSPDNLTLALRDAAELVAKIAGPPETVVETLQALPGVRSVACHSPGGDGPGSYTVRAEPAAEVRPAIVATATARRLAGL